MKGIWSAVSGAEAQSQKLDTIANNLANVDTAGFKKDDVTFKEHLTALEKPENQVIDIPRKEFELKDFYHHNGNDKSMVAVDGSFSDFSQGHLRKTTSPLDFAIEGSGFFEVHTPRGVRFSRSGNFKIANDGKLVTQNGYPVLSKIDPNTLLALQTQLEEAANPDPNAPAGDQGNSAGLIASIPPESRYIFLQPTGQLKVSPQGKVYQGKQEVTDLSLVEFKNAQMLKKEGSGLYINPDENNLNLEIAKTKVHQGFLEASNVNPVAELSNMVKTNRLFESLNKVMRAYDQMEGKAVDLGKFY